jgi:hypothetical protein
MLLYVDSNKLEKKLLKRDGGVGDLERSVGEVEKVGE